MRQNYLSRIIQTHLRRIARAIVAPLSAVALILAPVALHAQGPLAPPPGMPAPTMKTLQQIEPRTDLQAPTLPPGVTTDASYEFIISEPGSYYLSANLVVSKPNGIGINAAGFTLDLSGFEISRAGATTGNGIELVSTAHRAVVKNGAIKGFAYGLRCPATGNEFARGGTLVQVSTSGCTQYGIYAGESWHLEGCVARGNQGSGIYALRGSILTGCSATENAGSYAIGALDGSTLVHCTARFNTSQTTISGGAGCTLIGCTATFNTATYGIRAGAGSSLENCTVNLSTGTAAVAVTYGLLAEGMCTVRGCTASDNTVTHALAGRRGSTLAHCTANGNTSAAVASYGIVVENFATLIACTASENSNTNATNGPTQGVGISAGLGASVRYCSASSNKGNGIQVGTRCVVERNTSTGNGSATSSGNGAGIHVTGTDNRIEGNTVAGNDRGIDVDGTYNLIVMNNASVNGTNYDIVASNRYGPILNIVAGGTAAATGNAAASVLTSTDPWANFAQ